VLFHCLVCCHDDLANGLGCGGPGGLQERIWLANTQVAEKNLIQSRIKADKYEQLLTAPTEADETIISTIKEICVYYKKKVFENYTAASWIVQEQNFSYKNITKIR
jgi:hypothetical protein